MKSRIWIIIPAIAILVAMSCLYTVSEAQRAVKLKFGKVVESNVPPGLHWKLPPPFESIRYFEARNMLLDSPPTQFLTKESEYLEIDSYVIWRVADVEKFFTATGGNVRQAADLLAPRVRDDLKNAVSELTLRQVVFKERNKMMGEVRDAINVQAMAELGVEIVDIRTKAIDYPKEPRQNVFGQMRTAREQEARKIRAEGQEAALIVRATAEREKTELLAESYEQAQIDRGKGDAAAAAIYAKAYNKDPDFYQFYRSLGAYKATFSSKADVLVLEPDSEFFKYMNKSGN